MDLKSNKMSAGLKIDISGFLGSLVTNLKSKLQNSEILKRRTENTKNRSRDLKIENCG